MGENELATAQLRTLAHSTAVSTLHWDGLLPEHDTLQKEDPSATRLSMGLGRPFPPRLPDVEGFVVEFDGAKDPWKPYNWSSWTKLYIALIVCYGTFVASFDSALFAAGIAQASNEFSVSNEIGLLGTSLFVFGFASGPVIWAPGSELIGRRWPLCIGMLGCSIFTIGSAVAKDVQTLIICRFFAGVCGASPLCVAPAVLADLYTDVHRGVAISVYALTVFGGPLVAPFIGGFTAMSYLGWRWTLYLPAILGFFDVLLLLLFVKETYHPLILTQKASRIRHETGNWGIHAKQERVELDLHEVARTYFTRPLRMLATEPIVLVVSLYMSFIYGLVYALLEAYPVVFEDIYGMSPGVGGLPFLGLLAGVLSAVIFIVSQQGVYLKKRSTDNNRPNPEWRLVPVMIGAPAFAGGLFWFAWTGYKSSIHWISPTLAGVLIGFGVLCIFLPCFTYLVDAFLPLAASVVAANIIIRSAVAACFPLFSRQMFQNLGVQWAGTLLGCIATIMIPIPFVLRAYGPSLRSRSKFGAQSA